MDFALRAARQMDRKLLPFKRLRNAAPRQGWVRAIRSALHMGQTDLASRLGITQPSVDAFERAEARGTITMASLRKVAAAMECDLVYALVPRRGLAKSIQARAESLAEEMVRRTAHSMRMESQGVQRSTSKGQVRELAKALIAQPKRGFWRTVR